MTDPGVNTKAVGKHIDALHRGLSVWPTLAQGLPPALGDARWTDELILATWHMAEHGQAPEQGLEYRRGNSGGGFDLLRLKTLPEDEWLPETESIDISMPLNRRDDLPERRILVPFYGGGMSYGSVSEQVMIARAIAAREAGTYTCTGEGGYPPGLLPFRDHIITQVATGMFGVREETILGSPIIELKYAQGAKPGLGGHLLGDKSTMSVARLRGSVPWVSLFSPFPFHSVYSVEDHRKHVDWIKTINPRALISVKVSTPHDVDMVAVGSYFAGAHIIHLDGSYGGTGAAPEVAKKSIAMPIELAIPRVHNYLVAEGIRDEVTLIASGGIRSVNDMLKAIALGADGCVLGTADLVAMGCTRCSNCERGRGCPFGLTTTDPELSLLIETEWAAQRLMNLYAAYSTQFKSALSMMGLRNIADLRGRRDLLRYERGSE